MIEVIIKNYLAEKLSVPVVLEVPANSSKSFVLLEKTGSSRDAGDPVLRAVHVRSRKAQ